MKNVALIGSNFALRGYYPAIQKIKNFNLVILCSRNIKNKINTKIKLENNWKKVFNKKIDLIILAVPPNVQLKILKHNLKFKKDIIFEKPISNSYKQSEIIVKALKKKNIKSQINLTYIYNDLFNKVREVIKKKTLGKVINYNIDWKFVSKDLNNKIVSWKTDEKKGGGIKNIFLTHVLSYCHYFFNDFNIRKIKTYKTKIKHLTYKKKIFCELENLDNVKGSLRLQTIKNGYQNHCIEIKFDQGKIILYTKSKDWTKDFILKIYKKKILWKIIKSKNIYKFHDGRSQQIYNMLKNFNKKNFTNIDYCLKSEKKLLKIK